MNNAARSAATTNLHPSRWMMLLTVVAALVTTGSAFAYMLTKERPDAAQTSADQSTSNTAAPQQTPSTSP